MTKKEIEGRGSNRKNPCFWHGSPNGARESRGEKEEKHGKMGTEYSVTRAQGKASLFPREKHADSRQLGAPDRGGW